MYSVSVSFIVIGIVSIFTEYQNVASTSRPYERHQLIAIGEQSQLKNPRLPLVIQATISDLKLNKARGKRHVEMSES